MLVYVTLLNIDEISGQSIQLKCYNNSIIFVL